MKWIRKLVSSLIVINLLAVSLPMAANAQVLTGKAGENVTYRYDTSTGELSFLGTGRMADFFVGELEVAYPSYDPDYHMENQMTMPVDWTNARKVTFSEGITHIGKKTLESCEKIESISIPSTVTTIGMFAFSDCSALKEVVIPDSVTIIDRGAFGGCYNLTSVTISKNVSTIGGTAFASCSSLRTVTIPDSVTLLGGSAFAGCTGLSTVTIPPQASMEYNDVFTRCSNLKEILVAEGNEEYKSMDGVLYTKSGKALICYPNGKPGDSYTVLEGTNTIGANAFDYCTQLRTIKFPSTITYLGGESLGYYFPPFEGCKNLTLYGEPGSMVEKVAKMCGFGFVPWEYSPPVAGFSDVFLNDYYAFAVEWAVSCGVTSGTSATTFSPNQSCTRAQAVTFLWNAADRPEPTQNTTIFTDVPAGSYYEKAVQWAVENGITSGTSETTFSPDSPCTRAQIVTFLYKSNGSPVVSSGTSFADVEVGSYYEDAVKWAVEDHITSGTGETTFGPEDPCTRAQIVTFLFRDTM